MAKDYGARPTVGRDWYKAHGLGNDYLVFEEGEGWRVEPEAVALACHRHEGVGADGIVVVLRSAAEPFVLRMFQSRRLRIREERERATCFWQRIYTTGGGWMRAPSTWSAEETRSECGVHSRSADSRYDIEVEMGRARVGPEGVALDPKALDEQGRLAHPDAGRVPLVPVSVGNPHAVVVFVDALGGLFDATVLLRLATGLATHRAFAHGANVQLVRVTPPRTIDILIWERGVGPTTASGTSACASAVAAVASGRLDAGRGGCAHAGGEAFTCG